MSVPLRREDYEATGTYDRVDRPAEKFSTDLDIGPSSSLIAGLTEKAFERFREKQAALFKETQADARTNYNTQSPSANTSLSTDTAAVKTIAADVDRIVPQVRLTQTKTLTETVIALQEWEGYVAVVHESYFVANLINLTAGATRAEEEAEIPLKELREGDLEKVRPGRIFRWVIGYQRKLGTKGLGTKRRVSDIVFRELPRWTDREVGEAKSEAADLVNFFSALDDDPARNR